MNFDLFTVSAIGMVVSVILVFYVTLSGKRQSGKQMADYLDRHSG